MDIEYSFIYLAKCLATTPIAGEVEFLLAKPLNFNTQILIWKYLVLILDIVYLSSEQ